MGVDGKDGKDGESFSPSSDFMARLRTAEAKAHMRPNLRQRVLTDAAGLRDDMRELKSLMRLFVNGVGGFVRAQRRRKASEDDLAK